MADTLYTAVATATGDGRAGGRTSTDDGLLDVTLAVPRSMGGRGGATNPEQLFAAGWSSCFLSALKSVAAQRKVPVTDAAVVAEISVEPRGEGGFGLRATLHVELGGGIAQDVADSLTEAAHQVCPYSAATRGNVPVTLETTVA